VQEIFGIHEHIKISAAASPKKATSPLRLTSTRAKARSPA